MAEIQVADGGRIPARLRFGAIRLARSGVPVESALLRMGIRPSAADRDPGFRAALERAGRRWNEQLVAVVRKRYGVRKVASLARTYGIDPKVKAPRRLAPDCLKAYLAEAYRQRDAGDAVLGYSLWRLGDPRTVSAEQAKGRAITGAALERSREAAASAWRAAGEARRRGRGIGTPTKADSVAGSVDTSLE